MASKEVLREILSDRARTELHLRELAEERRTELHLDKMPLEMREAALAKYDALMHGWLGFVLISHIGAMLVFQTFAFFLPLMFVWLLYITCGLRSARTSLGFPVDHKSVSGGKLAIH